jgi:hypothetical protein
VYRVGDPVLDLAPRDTDFVDYFAVLDDERFVRVASQHVDRATLSVALLPLLTEQRTVIRVGDPAASIVLVQGTLKRPE